MQLINKEIDDHYESDHEIGSFVNDLADQFRSGRNLSDLLQLIRSDNLRYLEIGTWIASEVDFSQNKYCQQLVDKLWHISFYGPSTVRFHAVSALFPYLEQDKLRAKELLEATAKDSDESLQILSKQISKILE